VVGRRTRKGQAGEVRTKRAPAPVKPKETGKKSAASQPQTRAQPPAPRKKGKSKGRKRSVPRTAAVIITCPADNYKEVLKLAMDHIDPASLGIEGMTARRAVTGVQVFEVGGSEHSQKADALAGRLGEVLAGQEGVRVLRPSPTAELRVRDLYDAVDKEDVRKAIAFADKCPPDQVKVGLIRSTGRGLGTAWVRCPLAVANQLATARKLKDGQWPVLKHWRLDPSSASNVWVRATLGPNARTLWTVAHSAIGVGYLGTLLGTVRGQLIARSAQTSGAQPRTEQALEPVMPQRREREERAKLHKASPLSRRRGRVKAPPPTKEADVTSTPPQERMECEPLPQREKRVRADTEPVECSLPIDVESTPMEVAQEDPCSHN